MELFDPSLIGLQRAMSGSMLRQQVLANNLANANTPGYKRSDVDFQGALAQAFARGDEPSATGVGATQFAAQVDSTTTVRADGSNVDVDTEMSNLAENSLAYTALSSVVMARIKILETAMSAR